MAVSTDTATNVAVYATPLRLDFRYGPKLKEPPDYWEGGTNQIVYLEFSGEPVQTFTLPSNYYRFAQNQVMGTVTFECLADTAALFHDLAARWRCETAHLSNTRDKVLHESYQRIIGMGKSALPLILQEMAENGGHWFWALRAITGENPVPEEHRGKVPLMREDWLAWGRSRGYVA